MHNKKLFWVLLGAMATTCAASMDQVLLIINYNHAYYQSIPFLKKIYGPTFKNIVFFGPENHPDVIHCPHYKGYFSYTAIADAMQKFPHYKGYLFLHDDCILNTKILAAIDQDRIWVPEVQFGPGIRGNAIDIRQDTYTQWGWWNTSWGKEPMRKAFWRLPAKAKQILANNWGQLSVAYGYSDIAYIPAAYKAEFISLSAIFADQHAFLELALPTIIGCLSSKQEWVFLPGYNGGNDLAEFKKDLFFNHPVKLSVTENRVFVDSFFQQM